QVVGILGGHQARAGQRQGDAAGVAGDPAAAPLLGDVGGGAAAAGRVEHQVAGVGGHEEATLDDLRVGLNNIELFISELSGQRVRPNVVAGFPSEVVRNSDIPQAIFRGVE